MFLTEKGNCNCFRNDLYKQLNPQNKTIEKKSGAVGWGGHSSSILIEALTTKKAPLKHMHDQ